MNAEFVPLDLGRGDYTPAQIRALIVHFTPSAGLAVSVIAEHKFIDPIDQPGLHDGAGWMVMAFTTAVLLQIARIAARVAKQQVLAICDRLWVYFRKRNGGTSGVDPVTVPDNTTPVTVPGGTTPVTDPEGRSHSGSAAAG